MFSELQVFNNPEFGDVRLVDINGKPYAVGVDVARALNYAKPTKAVIDHCRGITKLEVPHPQTNQYGFEVTSIRPYIAAFTACSIHSVRSGIISLPTSFFDASFDESLAIGAFACTAVRYIRNRRTDLRPRHSDNRNFCGVGFWHVITLSA